VVREANAGLVSKGVPEQLAMNIRIILDDRDLREQMSESGKRVVQEKYLWSMVAVEMLAVYREILTGKRV
jgi:glycosyltransferase involved in cell wall biosynthesis